MVLIVVSPVLQLCPKTLTFPFLCTNNNNTNSQRINVKTKVNNKDDYNSTLKALNSKGRFPRKSLGQHYMLNSSINEQLASVADVKEGDLVLEIGPGTGSLTNVLVDAGATILAIEKDPHMAALVRERFECTGRTTILEEDFTKCDIRSHLMPLLRDEVSSDGQSRYVKVVANIPFNVTTDIIKLLLPMGDIFSEVVLLVQDETALRLVQPSLRTSEYRPINIFVNFYSDPEYNFHVPRSNFFPQPNVDAAVVTFRIKQAVDYPPVSSIKSFFSMGDPTMSTLVPIFRVHSVLFIREILPISTLVPSFRVNSAFNGKRKMLRRSLQHISTSLEIETALQNAGLPPTSRPEELTLDDFVRVHNIIAKA